MIEAVLTVIFGLAFCIAALGGVAYFWRAYYDRGTDQNETSYVRTSDGWKLAIHRYRPQQPPQGFPVILCHGLSANRYVFDMPGGPSLARYLRDHGRDVWVAELRGSGMSERPGLLISDVSLSWTFEDHLQYDVPAVIRHVLEQTGATGVHWIGHSMGGMLIIAYLAATPTPPLISAIAVGSPVDFSKLPEGLATLAHCERLFKPFPVFPLTILAKILVPVVHRIPPQFTRMFYAPNMSPFVARATLAVGTEILASNALWLDFGRFVRTGWRRVEDGREYREKLGSSRVPVLCVAGAADHLVGVEAVLAACNGQAASERRSRVFGKAWGGARGLRACRSARRQERRDGSVP